ncbi:MAG TPA: carboxypeptidase-like regulatory domain-containing protein [Vicinamibacterales bacterium]|nr:carboxypeptidase-like regulatory domain-containing protein [Vicinamibacterales bacterium]
MGRAPLRALPVFLALLTSAEAAAQQQPASPAPGMPVPGGAAPQMPTPGAPTPQMPPRDRRPTDAERGTATLRGVVMAADSGTPLRRAQVRVMASGGGPAGVHLTQTDAQGRYEVNELPAGRYTISVSRSGYVTTQFGQRNPNQMSGTPVELANGQLLEKINFALQRGGAISGRIVDDLGEPVAGVQVMAQRFAYMGGTRRLVQAGAEGGMDRTDDLGQFRLFGLPPGEYYVSASWRSFDYIQMNVSASGASDGFAPTYFPGTGSVGEARRVAVRAGQDLTNISFGLIPARLGRIAGRVTASSGEPLTGGMLMVTPRDDDLPFGPRNMITAQIRGDGTFQTAGLAPGTYSVNVQDRNAMNGTGEVGRVDVRVDGEDVNDVFIVTGRGGVIRGRIVTDAGSVPPFKPGQVRMFLAPGDPSRSTGFGFRPPTIKDDWTFEGSGIVDAVRINVSMDVQGGGWVARHAWSGNVDLLDTGVDVGQGQILEDVEVVITQKRTELSGQIADDRGQPVTDAWVVVFPDDKDRWTFGSRYLRPTRPDTNGKYTVRLTPYDRYRVVVVRGLEDGQWSDPEFLARALEYATTFALGEGETRVLNLRLADVK